uniref:uncharacterized protein LOC117606357 n=1 Tax=Osmia lignaria TaxID=473952 RepID=UPI0014782E60|nr:uncharacterized protein LOC117606357 [Osmia lignaria]
MDCESAASSSCDNVTVSDVNAQFDLWSSWKMCESMLEQKGYMKKSSSIQTSLAITEVATEMYNRIVAMMDEVELADDEEVILPDDDVGDDFESLSEPTSDEEVKNMWEDTSSVCPEHERDFIPLEYKKKVVAMARAYPKWSLATLQKKGASLLRKKVLLKTWEADIAAGRTLFDKYAAINDLTFKRFEEARNNLEQVTPTMLQQWALNYARELNYNKFTGSVRNNLLAILPGSSHPNSISRSAEAPHRDETQQQKRKPSMLEYCM